MVSKDTTGFLLHCSHRSWFWQSFNSILGTSVADFYHYINPWWTGYFSKIWLNFDSFLINIIFLYNVVSMQLIFNQHCRQCWEFPPVHQPKAHKFCKGRVTIWSDDPAGTFPTSMNNTFFTNPQYAYMAWSMMICFHKFTPITASTKFIYVLFQCVCCILDNKQEFWK